MKWPIRIIAFCLIFAFWQDSIAARIEVWWPELTTTYVDPFISKSYQWYDDKGVNILWWVKYCCNDLQLIIIMVCFTKIAYYVSRRLFSIGLVFSLYCMSDHFMLWYDYKQSSGMYWFLDIAAVVNIILLFTVKDIKQGAIKSLK